MVLLKLFKMKTKAIKSSSKGFQANAVPFQRNLLYNDPFYNEKLLSKKYLCYQNMEIADFSFSPTKGYIRESKLQIKSVPYLSAGLEGYIRQFTENNEELKETNLKKAIENPKKRQNKQRNNLLMSYQKKIPSNSPHIGIAEAKRRGKNINDDKRYQNQMSQLEKKQSLRLMCHLSKVGESIIKIRKDCQKYITDNVNENLKELDEISCNDKGLDSKLKKISENEIGRAHV